MGMFDLFLYRHTNVHGYFREGAEAEFPWSDTSKAVWYAVLTVEDGRIRRYGFTAATGQKAALRNLLLNLKDTGIEAILLGVWTGGYSTSLFILDFDIAIARLV
jgi:hypothetical protein